MPYHLHVGSAFCPAHLPFVIIAVVNFLLCETRGLASDQRYQETTVAWVGGPHKSPPSLEEKARSHRQLLLFCCLVTIFCTPCALEAREKTRSGGGRHLKGNENAHSLP